LPLPAYTSLVATVEDGHVALRDIDNVLISADIGVNGCIMPADYDEGGLITFESSVYRGGLILIVNNSVKLTVINYVTMDEYLYGVLHREMSQSSPIEALKAQAVAARSFAANNLDRHSKDGFDFCTTTDCQVYGGYAAEYPSTTQAVDETSGLLVWVGDEPVSVYYFKNSGGHTQSIVDVWSSFSTHLIGKADPYSPDYPWTATIYFDNLQQKLSQAGYDSGTITSVRVGGRNTAGAVSKLVIEGSNGTILLEKERIRSVLGTSLIRSRHFNIGDTYKGATTTAPTEVNFKLSNGHQVSDVGETLYVLSASGSAKTMNSQDIYLSNGTKTIKIEADATKLLLW
jgi:stage II sporulation protein D